MEIKHAVRGPPCLLQELTLTGIDVQTLPGCAIFVNNQPAAKRKKLTDSSTVVLMPPVVGG